MPDISIHTVVGQIKGYHTHGKHGEVLHLVKENGELLDYELAHTDLSGWLRNLLHHKNESIIQDKWLEIGESDEGRLYLEVLFLSDDFDACHSNSYTDPQYTAFDYLVFKEEYRVPGTKFYYGIIAGDDPR